VEAVQKAAWRMRGGWLVEVDIKKFFDTVDHAHLRDILGQRIGDGVLLRLIGKWLNAGVVEGLELSYPDEGTPQGGVISPLLANIYLHTVVDEWFVRDIQPALSRSAQMVRYADDLVVLFESRQDAERFLAVLPKRFGKYGLTLHPDKTRMVSFHRPDRVVDDDEDGPGTFDFLGFTHFWAVSRKGNWVVKQQTAKDRFRRALHRVRTWCRWNRHNAVEEQHRALSRKLKGHYAYYGISSNFRRISSFMYQVRRAWHAALSRRSQRKMSWRTMETLLERFPLPAPRIVHRYGT
jgi:group II intron reverse transcriptase/maturase